MALLDDLLAWSTTLPMWQRDAMRRLFASDDLTDADHQELLQLLKFEYGLAAPPEFDAQPLGSDHVQAGFGNDPVSLLGMSNLRDVNGFPEGREITFEPTGMTIVFGENGAGKSGYARVLKSACKARKNEKVLPNAFTAAAGPPKAQIRFQVGIEVTAHQWEQGRPSHPKLGAIAVYDALCANNYIAQDGVPAFQPFGLKHVTRLAEVCVELARRVKAEVDGLPRDTTPFQGFKGETAVGRLVAKLGPETDLDEITRLGTLSDIETARLEELARALVELNPEPKAKALDNLATRLNSLVPLARTAATYATNAAIGRLQEYIDAAATAGEAHTTAATLMMGKELLPGTGGALWRGLFKAAEAYSTRQAYPDHAHPHVGNDAKCVLCQTTLDDAATDRLSRFGAFVSGETQKAADIANTTLESARDAIARADFTLGIDAALQAEIRDAEPALHRSILDWGAAWNTRGDCMLRAAQDGTWSAPPPLPDGATLAEQLSQAAERATSGAATLRASGDPGEREKLKNEHFELQARSNFSPHVQSVVKLVKNARLATALQSMNTAALKTLPISRKATEFADKHISTTLLAGLKEELSELGYRRTIQQRIPIKTDKGVSKVIIALEGTDEKAEAVLSEGEQRATALAFFLAEMRLAPAKSSLVFDDPVTSMDHHFRRAVAVRLVKIAQERQVIVFTHDAIFVAALHHACNDLQYKPAYRRIEWDERPGAVADELGWQQMNVSGRLNNLESQLADMKKTWEQYASEASKAKMTTAYGNLRGTIERLIREVYLKNTLEPYGDEVRVQVFYTVANGVPPEELEQIMDIYDRACGVMNAHDTPTEHQIPLPTPDVLQMDIATLRSAVTAAEERRKQGNKLLDARKAQRKSLAT